MIRQTTEKQLLNDGTETDADSALDSRITSQRDILGGKPIIRGTRISVEFIMELIASGGSITQIVQSYPFLSESDVRQAVAYAT